MLVDQEAKRLGITTTPAEIDQRLAEVKQQIAKSPQGGSLDTLLSQNHETMANFRDSLRLRLEADKISAKTLPAITIGPCPAPAGLEQQSRRTAPHSRPILTPRQKT